MSVTVKPSLSKTVEKPELHLVTIINDGYVSWVFSMKVLTTIFHRSDEDALAITDAILNDGEGLCGGYIYEIAETKAKAVEELAKEENFSLYCLIEKV